MMNPGAVRTAGSIGAAIAVYAGGATAALVTAPTATPRPASAVVAPADVITLQVNFTAPRITYTGAYARVQMNGLPSAAEVGKPVLPFRPVRLLIPRGKDIRSVVVDRGELVTIPGRYTVEPGQQPADIASAFPTPVPPATPDPAVYASTAPYPADAKTALSVQVKRPYRMQLLNLNPVMYIPAAGRLSYYRSLTVRVYLSARTTTASWEMTRVPDARDEAMLRASLDNPWTLPGYAMLTPVPVVSSYPHVIITSEALMNPAQPGPFRFQTLRDFRRARGMNSTIVTTEWIYANFSGLRPDGLIDNPTRIRNFIAWAWEYWGTRYVMLGGDRHVIPLRAFEVRRHTDGPPDGAPADLYYADLDGTFDGDRDGIYGEPGDGEGGGEVDLFAELYVGRACVSNAGEVSNLVGKTIAYENALTSTAHPAWLLAEKMDDGPDGYFSTGDSNEIAARSSAAGGYRTSGFGASAFFQTRKLHDIPPRRELPPRVSFPGYTWSKEELAEIINSGVSVLNHIGHANVHSGMRFDVSDLPLLANGMPFFLYTQGCLSGNLAWEHCFAEDLTAMKHGAFAAVANSLVGTGGVSQYYNREFWDALFGEGIAELGRMNADSKEDCAYLITPSEDSTPVRMRLCCYELNLFGDPAAQIAR